MASSRRPLTTAPGLVRALNPITRLLLQRRMPMGPNTLMTVRGRRTGEPHTFPVAVSEIDRRLWVISPYGEVNWVRNLRSAGTAVLRRDGGQRLVKAVELSPAEARLFYADRLARYVRSLPLVGRGFARVFLPLAGARAMLDDPTTAAQRFPVFELIEQAA